MLDLLLAGYDLEDSVKLINDNIHSSGKKSVNGGTLLKGGEPHGMYMPFQTNSKEWKI